MAFSLVIGNLSICFFLPDDCYLAISNSLWASLRWFLAMSKWCKFINFSLSWTWSISMPNSCFICLFNWFISSIIYYSYFSMIWSIMLNWDESICLGWLDSSIWLSMSPYPTIFWSADGQFSRIACWTRDEIYYLSWTWPCIIYSRLNWLIC